MSKLNRRLLRRAGWLGVLGLVAFCGPAARGQEAGPAPAKEAVQSQIDDAVAKRLNLGRVCGNQSARPEQPKLKKYWLGVDGIPADDTLRAQLDLPEGQGVVLNQVVEDSPAAKAGLKQHDVLLTADGKPLAQLSDLAALIQEKQEQQFPIKLVRGARQIIIDVQPGKRPASQTGETCPRVSDVDDATFLRRVYLDVMGLPPTVDEAKAFQDDNRADKREQLVNKLLRCSKVATKSCTACHAPTDSSSASLFHDLLVAGRGHGVKVWDLASAPAVRDLAIHALGYSADGKLLAAGSNQPAAVVQSDPPRELPDDMTITITRQGRQPAKISAKQGEQAWETTSEKLDSLPENVRAHVEQALGIHRVGDSRRIVSAASDKTARLWESTFEDARRIVRIGVPAKVNVYEPPAEPEAAAEKLKQQLQRLKEEFEAAQKTLEELRKSLPAKTPKPEDGEKK